MSRELPMTVEHHRPVDPRFPALKEAINGGLQTRIIGHEHKRRDGKTCHCGCRLVAGHKGIVIERGKLEDTDLAGLVICEFVVYKHGLLVAYYLEPTNPIYIGGRE